MDPGADAAGAEPGGVTWAGIWGAILVGLAVAIGALGTHYLVGRIPVAREATLDTAVRYQFVSGFGLLLLAALSRSQARSQRLFHWSGVCLLVGALLFCGSLYLLVAGGPGLLGAVAPLGGAGMIGGWALLAAALAGSRRKSRRKSGP